MALKRFLSVTALIVGMTTVLGLEVLSVSWLAAVPTNDSDSVEIVDVQRSRLLLSLPCEPCFFHFCPLCVPVSKAAPACKWRIWPCATRSTSCGGAVGGDSPRSEERRVGKGCG